MLEIQVRSVDWEDPLEKEMATHSNILGWQATVHEVTRVGQDLSNQRYSERECNAIFWNTSLSFWHSHCSLFSSYIAHVFPDFYHNPKFQPPPLAAGWASYLQLLLPDQNHHNLHETSGKSVSLAVAPFLHSSSRVRSTTPKIQWFPWLISLFCSPDLSHKVHSHTGRQPWGRHLGASSWLSLQKSQGGEREWLSLE